MQQNNSSSMFSFFHNVLLCVHTANMLADIHQDFNMCMFGSIVYFHLQKHVRANPAKDAAHLNGQI